VSEDVADERPRLVPESGELYRALVLTLPDVVMVFHEGTGRCVLANPAAARLFGYSGDELLTLRLADLIAPNDLPDVSGVLDEVRRDGHWRGLVAVRLRDGSSPTLEGVASYLVINGRGLFQAVFRDVTDRLRAEMAERERARLEGALLAARTAQHELNNQLALIVGYADILGSEETLSAEARGVLEMIQDAAAATTSIVDALRRIARLEEVDLGGPGPVLDLERSTEED
jgi:PAS domain S-box-containing protein